MPVAIPKDESRDLPPTLLDMHRWYGFFLGNLRGTLARPEVATKLAESLVLVYIFYLVVARHPVEKYDCQFGSFP